MKKGNVMNMFIVLMMVFTSIITPYATVKADQFNLTLKSDCQEIVLSWDKIVGAKYYWPQQVFDDGSTYPLIDFASEELTFTQIKLEQGKEYCYFVKATDENGEEVARSEKKCVKTECPKEDCKYILEYTVGQKNYKVDGVQSTTVMDSPPVIVNNRTMLSARYVIDEVKDATIEWNAEDKSVTIRMKQHPLYEKDVVDFSDKIIIYKINKNMVNVDGKDELIDKTNPDVMPMIINGRTMIPFRNLGEKLSATVDYIPTTKTIKLTFECVYKKTPVGDNDVTPVFTTYCGCMYPILELLSVQSGTDVKVYLNKNCNAGDRLNNLVIDSTLVDEALHLTINQWLQQYVYINAPKTCVEIDVTPSGRIIRWKAKPNAEPCCCKWLCGCISSVDAVFGNPNRYRLTFDKECDNNTSNDMVVYIDANLVDGNQHQTITQWKQKFFDNNHLTCVDLCVNENNLVVEWRAQPNRQPCCPTTCQWTNCVTIQSVVSNGLNPVTVTVKDCQTGEITVLYGNPNLYSNNSTNVTWGTPTLVKYPVGSCAKYCIIKHDTVPPTYEIVEWVAIAPTDPCCCSGQCNWVCGCIFELGPVVGTDTNKLFFDTNCDGGNYDKTYYIDNNLLDLNLGLTITQWRSQYYNTGKKCVDLCVDDQNNVIKWKAQPNRQPCCPSEPPCVETGKGTIVSCIQTASVIQLTFQSCTAGTSTMQLAAPLNLADSANTYSSIYSYFKQSGGKTCVNICYNPVTHVIEWWSILPDDPCCPSEPPCVETGKGTIVSCIQTASVIQMTFQSCTAGTSTMQFAAPLNLADTANTYSSIYSYFKQSGGKTCVNICYNPITHVIVWWSILPDDPCCPVTTCCNDWNLTIPTSTPANVLSWDNITATACANPGEKVTFSRLVLKNNCDQPICVKFEGFSNNFFIASDFTNYTNNIPLTQPVTIPAHGTLQYLYGHFIVQPCNGASQMPAFVIKQVDCTTGNTIPDCEKKVFVKCCETTCCDFVVRTKPEVKLRPLELCPNESATIDYWELFNNCPEGSQPITIQSITPISTGITFIQPTTPLSLAAQERKSISFKLTMPGNCTPGTAVTFKFVVKTNCGDKEFSITAKCKDCAPCCDWDFKLKTDKKYAKLYLCPGETATIETYEIVNNCLANSTPIQFSIAIPKSSNIQSISPSTFTLNPGDKMSLTIKVKMPDCKADPNVGVDFAFNVSTIPSQCGKSVKFTVYCKDCSTCCDWDMTQIIGPKQMCGGEEFKLTPTLTNKCSTAIKYTITPGPNVKINGSTSPFTSPIAIPAGGTFMFTVLYTMPKCTPGQKTTFTWTVKPENCPEKAFTNVVECKSCEQCCDWDFVSTESSISMTNAQLCAGEKLWIKIKVKNNCTADKVTINFTPDDSSTTVITPQTLEILPGQTMEYRVDFTMPKCTPGASVKFSYRYKACNKDLGQNWFVNCKDCWCSGLSALLKVTNIDLKTGILEGTVLDGTAKLSMKLSIDTAVKKWSLVKVGTCITVCYEQRKAKSGDYFFALDYREATCPTNVSHGGRSTLFAVTPNCN